MSKYNGKFASNDKEKNEKPTNDPEAKPRKKKWQWVLLSVLLVVLALLIAAIVFVWTKLNQIERVDPKETYMSQEEWDAYAASEQTELPDAGTYPALDPDAVEWGSNPNNPIGQDDTNIVNILLIGQDRRSGEGRARSDSMILVSFNKTDKKITLVSFLRDNYVQIPGYQDNRLNTAYAIGGMELLDETLSVNFGVSIDANVEVDFSGFTSIIDLLGGVDIELTSAEANHLNNLEGWSLRSGENHLTGEQALSYSRIRYLDSDFGRTNRQRNVLTSLLESFKDISLTKALKLVDEIFPLLTTDMTNKEIISNVTTLLPILSKAEINTMHIPGEDDYYSASIRGMAVIVPDYDACRELLSEALS